MLQWLFLPFLWGQVQLRSWKEEIRIRKFFYPNSLFQKADTLLKKQYRRISPYTVCRKHRQSLGKQEIHVYGETPLTSMHKILSSCQMSSTDTFIDLGCGRGRLLLLTAAIWGARSIGIEIVPLFAEKAEHPFSLISITPEILTENMLASDLTQGTIFYFHALCLDEEIFHGMLAKLSTLSKSIKIITVGFALQDYSPLFSTIECLENIPYPWGKTAVFINQPS